MTETNYDHLTHEGNKIQVDSAIRDGNGARIDTNYQKKPTIYERTTYSDTSTTCTLIQFNATDYKANGYLAHFKFRVKSALHDNFPSDNEFIINYSCLNSNIICTNSKTVTMNDIVQSIYAYYPNSNSYLDTGNYFIAFKTSRTSTNFILEMIEADVPYTVPATMSASITTNTTYQTLAPGSYSSSSPLMWTGTAVGSINGSSESANYAIYATRLQKNKFIGENVYESSLCGIDTSGSLFRLLTSGKKFPLPIQLTVPNSTYDRPDTATVMDYYASYTLYVCLRNSTYQGGSGYTCPTLTANDGGKTLYIRGLLDTVDGEPVFVPDGNVTLDMSAGGHTYIPFGELYKSSSSSIPSYFYWKFENTTAYTLDANGKLTHIDGKEISGGGVIPSVEGITYTKVATKQDFDVAPKNEGDIFEVTADSNEGNNGLYLFTGIGPSEIAKVACGYDTTWVVTTDGKLFGCGMNEDGQQGDGTTDDVTVFTQRLSEYTIIDVVTSDYTTWAIGDNGWLFGCGYGEDGQQGSGALSNVSSFTTRADFAGNIQKVACSGSTTWLLTTNNRLYGCGYNGDGQQGDGTTTNVTRFTRRLSDQTIARVVCSDSTTWALTTDGKLFGCGLNENGQQGSGNTTDVTTFTRRLADHTIKDVVCSDDTTWVVTTDGKLFGCGSNDHGQLGIDGYTNLTVFSQRLTTRTIKKVACSYNTTWALTTDGKLFGCGDNTCYQQGDGTTTDVTTFTRRLANQTIKDVVCSDGTTWALTTDGKLFGCGDNFNGQQGSGDTTNVTTFTQRLADQTVKEIMCSGSTTWALTDDGKLLACGSGWSGQLGKGTSGSNTFTRCADNVSHDTYGLLRTTFEGTGGVTVTTTASKVTISAPNITVSDQAPTGGSNGDIWIQY